MEIARSAGAGAGCALEPDDGAPGGGRETVTSLLNDEGEFAGGRRVCFGASETRAGAEGSGDGVGRQIQKCATRD